MAHLFCTVGYEQFEFMFFFLKKFYRALNKTQYALMKVSISSYGTVELMNQREEKMLDFQIK